MRLKPVAPFAHAAGAARHHRRRHPRPRRDAGLVAMRSDSAARGLLRRRRRASIRNAGWTRQRPVARPRPTGSRCRSAPARASAPAATWRCWRSRWRWRRCSAASTSSGVGTPGGGEPDERMSFAMGPSRLGDAPARRALTPAARRLRPSAASACSQSAIRSSTASRPTEKRTSVPVQARLLAHRRQVVGHRQAHRAGPRVADLEQLQRIDEGIDLRAAEARDRRRPRTAPPPREQSAAQCSWPGEPGSAGWSTGDDLGRARPPLRELAAAAVLRRVAQRQRRQRRAARPRRRWPPRPSPCACASHLSAGAAPRRASSPSPSARRRRPRGTWSAPASRCRRPAPRPRRRARRRRTRARRPRCCRARPPRRAARAQRAAASRRSGNSIVTEPGASSQTSRVAGAIAARSDAASIGS